MTPAENGILSMFGHTLNSHFEMKRKRVDKTGKVNISALKWNMRARKRLQPYNVHVKGLLKGKWKQRAV